MSGLPEFFQIRQRFERREIENPAEETARQLDALRLGASAGVRPGQSVAITAGSRGIANIAAITQATVRHFQRLGLMPFVVPAMGSHGGATAEGQIALLEKYGITEESLGCPIRSSMQTVVLGSLRIDERLEIPIHFDRFASEADHVFLINRVKPHTRFAGPIESGLLKMLMIGLGKEEGASLYHRAVADDRFSVVVRQTADSLLSRLSVLGGLGIVENAFDRTAILRAGGPDELAAIDTELLIEAKRLLPRLPFEEIDLLLIDRIGKNISGTGLDTNVVGRKFDDHKAVRGETPVVRCIGVLGLTPETGGNANGIGIAEFCKTSVLREMNVEETRINAITANHVSAAMLPLDYPTEREIIEATSRTLGRIPIEELKILWITDTLHLETLRCSRSFLPEAKQLAAWGRIEIL